MLYVVCAIASTRPRLPLCRQCTTYIRTRCIIACLLTHATSTIVLNCYMYRIPLIARGAQKIQGFHQVPLASPAELNSAKLVVHKLSFKAASTALILFRQDAMGETIKVGIDARSLYGTGRRKPMFWFIITTISRATQKQLLSAHHQYSTENKRWVLNSNNLLVLCVPLPQSLNHCQSLQSHTQRNNCRLSVIHIRQRVGPHPQGHHLRERER